MEVNRSQPRQKVRYRGLSNGKLYYVSAYSIEQMRSMLRQQALRDVGKYTFTDYQKFNEKTNAWERISA